MTILSPCTTKRRPRSFRDSATLRHDPRDAAEICVFYQQRFLCRAICPELAGKGPFQMADGVSALSNKTLLFGTTIRPIEIARTPMIEIGPDASGRPARSPPGACSLHSMALPTTGHRDSYRILVLTSALFTRVAGEELPVLHQTRLINRARKTSPRYELNFSCRSELGSRIYRRKVRKGFRF